MNFIIGMLVGFLIGLTVSRVIDLLAISYLHPKQ